MSTATYIGREWGLPVRHCSVTYTGLTDFWKLPTFGHEEAAGC